MTPPGYLNLTDLSPFEAMRWAKECGPDVHSITFPSAMPRVSVERFLKDSPSTVERVEISTDLAWSRHNDAPGLLPQLTDEDLVAVAHGLGLFRWRDMTELRARVQSWPGPIPHRQEPAGSRASRSQPRDLTA